MRTGDAHRQGGKNIKNFLQQLTIFPQNRSSLQNTTSKKLKFLFSFNSFKSLKLRAMRSKMTNGTTMVTNNVFRSTRLFGKRSSNIVLFSLQLWILRSYVINHTTIVTSGNKLISTKISRMGPKQRVRLKNLSLHLLISFV